MTQRELRSPTVSVVIHTYNHAKYIAEAIESVLSQSIIKSAEIIIVDDCSTDETTTIIRRYKSQFPLYFRIFANPFNRLRLGFLPGYQAIKTINAPYVAFLDGDDYWTDTKKLEKQVVILNENESLSGCAHSTDIVDNLVHPARYWRYTHTERLVSFDDIAHPVTPFHTSSFMMRSVYLEYLLRVYKYNPTCVSGDLVLYASAAAHGPIAFLPQAMSAYRLHTGGITRNSVHGSQFSFFHNRLRMWRGLSCALGIKSETVVNLMADYQAQAVGSFAAVIPTIALLSDGVIRPDRYVAEGAKRALSRCFDDSEVVFLVKQDSPKAVINTESCYPEAGAGVVVYSSTYQLIEVLDSLVLRSKGPLILCSAGNIRIDRMLESMFNNSAFTISENVVDRASVDGCYRDIFLCFNHREFALRFLDECRAAVKFDVEYAFLECVRIALGKFNVASPAVVSVVDYTGLDMEKVL